MNNDISMNELKELLIKRDEIKDILLCTEGIAKSHLHCKITLQSKNPLINENKNIINACISSDINDVKHREFINNLNTLIKNYYNEQLELVENKLLNINKIMRY